MPDNWEQVKEILASALERDPLQRSGFVREACGEDAALLADVESLLSHYDQADSLLENSPHTETGEPFSSQAGKKVGAYRLLRECGQGGMAVVYLGERDDRLFRKRVAIKMLKPGAHGEQVVRRFYHERQTLAAMDHPNIVKLLDGGSTDDGLPYLVMDFVEGLPIDRYCDLHQLTIAQRLQLFRSVCSAVHYAHQMQVIHRDLKPSNVLITPEGVPRLLDFGIAKLLNPEWLETRLITQSDWRPMTPEYASPEQMQGKAVTASSDIYSLGVLLYQLLSGRRPHQVAGRSLFEFERLVCEVDPEKPSAAIFRRHTGGTEGPSPEQVSQARRTTPAELRRRLQGDLDTIVLKALSREPERRYSCVEALSEDIERHACGIPVRARRATIWYRGSRFVRRHREALATAMLVLALMAVLAGLELRRTRPPTSAPVTPARVENAPLSPARPSIAVLGFRNVSGRPETAWVSTALSEMLATELTAGEKLRAIPSETVARTKIEMDLPDTDALAAATLARVRADLGSDFVVLGSYIELGDGRSRRLRVDIRLQDTAKGETVAALSESGSESQLLQLVADAGARLRKQFGVTPVSPDEMVGVLAAVPSNPQAMRLYAQGLAKLRGFDALSARDLFERAVASDPSYPLAHSALAKALLTLGYDPKARVEAKRAVDLARNLSREERLLVQARYDEADRQWDKAADAYRELIRAFPDDPEYRLALASAQTSGGRGKDSLVTLAALQQWHLQAGTDPRIDLAISEAASSLGDNRLRRDAAARAASRAEQLGAKLLQARALNQQCRAQANMGEIQQATAACEKARQIYAAAGDRSGLAQSLHTAAEVPIDQGDFVTAGKLYQQALALVRQIGDQKGIARETVNLGVVAKSEGDLATSLRMYNDALQGYRTAGNKEGIALTMGNMGNVLRLQGKLPGALRYYQDALAISNQVGIQGSAALAHAAIAYTLFEMGDLAGADQHYQQALEILTKVGEKGYYASTLMQQGQLQWQRGRLEEARKTYADALSREEELKNRGDAAETRLALAELDCDSGNPAEAENLARAALAEFVSQKEVDDQVHAEIVLARALRQQGKTAEASQATENALKDSRRSVNQLDVQWPLAIEHAYMLAATRQTQAARQVARNVQDRTRQAGLLRLQMQATMLLGKVESQGTNPAAGKARLRELAKMAQSKGFGLIASQAEAAAH